MNLHHTHESCIQVIRFRLLRIENLDIVCSSRNTENLAVEEITRKLPSFESSWCDNQEEITSFFCNFFEDTEQNICIDGPLMCLIEHNDRILTKVLINEGLPEEHTVSHVLNKSFTWGMILEPDGIPHLFSQFDIHFLANSLGDAHGCNSSRLGAPNFSSLGKASVEEILSDLGGFPAASFSNNNQNVVIDASLN